MSKNTGGPAFPTTRDSNYEVCSKGISIRDYFAAKAMQGRLASFPDGVRVDDALLTAFAYRVADAMIAEREK